MYECWCEKQTDEWVGKTWETVASCALPRPRGRCAACSGFFSSPNFCHRLREFQQKEEEPEVRGNSISSFWRVRAWKQAWRTWETSTHSRLITGKQKQQKTIRWSTQKRTSNAKNIFLSLFFVVLLRMEMQALITSCSTYGKGHNKEANRSCFQS